MLPAFHVSTLKASAAITATGVSSALDLSDYEGPVVIVLQSTASGSGVTNAMKITNSATSGGTYTDVTGGGFTTVGNSASQQAITVNTDEMLRFIKLDATVTGTGEGIVSASVIGFKKYR